MLAGTAKIDVTADGPVWMEGMLREHPSEGVHDPLFARALVLGNDEGLEGSGVVVSVDVCTLRQEDTDLLRAQVERQVGMPARRVVVAGTHTHSGPAVVGNLVPRATEYVEETWLPRLLQVVRDAARNVQPARLGFGSGREDTISHYRRLLADDGRVVMNWERIKANMTRAQSCGNIDRQRHFKRRSAVYGENSQASRSTRAVHLQSRV